MKTLVTLALLLPVTLLYAQGKKKKTSAEKHHIDHLIVAINNLDTGIVRFERLTGIRPVVGGEHPGRGTHNALVSLGDATYLEIIAPRQNLDSNEFKLSSYLLAYEDLTPTGWAVHLTDPGKSKELVTSAGIATTSLSDGGRIKPDGTKLSWTTFGIGEELAGAPFFIKWGDGSKHPSSTSPKGVKLSKVYITSPDAEKLSVLLKALGIESTVTKGDLSMKLVLSAPNGTVSLQ